MKRTRYFLAIVIISGIVFGYAVARVSGTLQETGKSNSSSKKRTFLLIYKPGPAWLAGKPLSEQPLKEHGKYMLSLYKSGIMRFAGPFDDNTGGAAVLEVSGDDEAKKVVNDDPAVSSRVFVYELHPWQLVPWEQYVKP